MERVVQVARETGHLDGVQNFRSTEVYGHLPADKVLALCTGSQGEPRAALARIARDDHPHAARQRAAHRRLEDRCDAGVGRAHR
jgi:ribonuclease J